MHENLDESLTYLNINETKPEDAGLYYCLADHGEYRAQLIILGNVVTYYCRSYRFY